ncbi:MAG: DUF3109 family protein [Bacteroidales bacterium]|nr:DUF3109 family protein [Bacteroidales bacterium]
MGDYRVIAIGDILISTALLTERFACDMAVCRGYCCVEGESGAPLEEHEVGILEREYQAFAPYMTPAGREAVSGQGVAIVDTDGEWVTPLVKGAECAYALFDSSGTCWCAIERAFLEGKTTFRKPVSCWLYPVRIQTLSTGCALNYHQWHLCVCARERGNKEGVPVYRFLKEALIAKFGEGFYEELDMIFNLASDGSL